MANCKVLDFIFLDKPAIRPRTPLEGMSPKELESITKLPYRIGKNCHFSVIVKVDDQEIEFRATIPKGFCYNMANIIDPFEPFTYDKHSPFVKDASLIHDYLLCKKVDLYKNWDMQKYKITPSNFRKITSEIFCIVLKKNAVEDKKANLMAGAVDIWQILQWKTWRKVGRE